MDAVSDVLRVLRLTGAVYLNGALTAPWCLIGRADTALCAAYLPRSERVVSYHLIIEGSCWAQLADDPDSAIQVNAGELLVVPQGDTHLMGSALDLPPVPTGLLLASQIEATPGEVMALLRRWWNSGTHHMRLFGLRRYAEQPIALLATANLQD